MGSEILNHLSYQNLAKYQPYIELLGGLCCTGAPADPLTRSKVVCLFH